jgi:hypothetical protein
VTKLRARASLACRIVDLDRVKFNDAVASGIYPCAPGTLRGSARIFDEEALLPLYFFARLTDFGIHASKAGRLACEMASYARSDHAALSPRIICVVSEIDTFFAAEKITMPDGTVKIFDRNESQRTAFSIDFHVANVRKLIADRLEEERNILGEDDDA